MRAFKKSFCSKFTKMNDLFSLAPGFSPVLVSEGNENRFNGFSPVGKPLKRLAYPRRSSTRLKPGVNETSSWLPVFAEFKN